jgi:hypothetical protein
MQYGSLVLVVCVSRPAQAILLLLNGRRVIHNGRGLMIRGGQRRSAAAI